MMLMRELRGAHYYTRGSAEGGLYPGSMCVVVVLMHNLELLVPSLFVFILRAIGDTKVRQSLESC
jgi:hypothetical protein